MPGKSFLDTNIWIYAAAGRLSERDKYVAASALIEKETFAVSPQIVGEFWVNVRSTKKMKRPLDIDEASFWVDRMQAFPMIDATRETVAQTLLIERRFNLNFWDAAVVASAERFGAATLYSEDFNHGQTYGSVRVVNPFRTN